MKNADSVGSDSYFIRRPAALANRKDIEQEMPENASIVSTPSSKKPGGHARKSKAAAVLERSPVLGWRTSDEDEIGLRRWRGCTEIHDVVALDPDRGFFGEFRVRSASQSGYDVEIRSLDGLTNSCGCIDHRVNALGTCKHIEGVLAALRRGKVRAFRAAAVAPALFPSPYAPPCRLCIAVALRS